MPVHLKMKLVKKQKHAKCNASQQEINGGIRNVQIDIYQRFLKTVKLPAVKIADNDLERYQYCIDRYRKK